MRDPKDSKTSEMFPEPQAHQSLQDSASSFFPAEPDAQAPHSLQESAGSQFPARTFYCLDPGTRAGILCPDGTYILQGIGKRGKLVKAFNMDQVMDTLRGLQPGTIRTEYAKLPNGKGVTKAFIQTLQSLGWIVRVCNTRDAYKGRAEKCLSGHGTKEDGCYDCTKRDLDAMASRVEKDFYIPRFDRKRVGSKNVSGTAAAIFNTRLNMARFNDKPYENLLDRMPSWLTNAFGDYMAPATLYLAAEVAVEFGYGVRLFRRLLGNHQHARRCQSYSNMQYHYEGDLKVWNKMALRIFKQLRAQAQRSLRDSASSRLPAPERKPDADI